MDLISRAAAIDVMCELMRHWFGGDPKDEIREIKRELEKLPSAQPEQRWIPCSKRLPFDAGYYLTTTTYNEVFCDYWNLNEWNRTEQVIAWMPLPEPYREVSEK